MPTGAQMGELENATDAREVELVKQKLDQLTAERKTVIPGSMAAEVRARRAMPKQRATARKDRRSSQEHQRYSPDTTY